MISSPAGDTLSTRPDRIATTLMPYFSRILLSRRGMPDPLVEGLNLHEAVAGRQLHIIDEVIAGQVARQSDSHIFFRHDHLVRADPFQDFGVGFPGRLRDDTAAP